MNTGPRKRTYNGGEDGGRTSKASKPDPGDVESNLSEAESENDPVFDSAPDRAADSYSECSVDAGSDQLDSEAENDDTATVDDDYVQDQIDRTFYPFPFDDGKEIERLRFLDLVVRKHIRIPRPTLKANESRVLDIGTGEGNWAIWFAEEHPTVNVEAIDIRRDLFPESVPQNLKFIQDDFELPLTNLYRYVHGRALTGSVRNWLALLKGIFEGLEAGGRLELHDFDPRFSFADGTSLAHGHPFNRLHKWAEERCLAEGQILNPVPKLEKWLTETGFTITKKTVTFTMKTRASNTCDNDCKGDKSCDKPCKNFDLYVCRILGILEESIAKDPSQEQWGKLKQDVEDTMGTTPDIMIDYVVFIADKPESQDVGGAQGA